MRGPSLILFSVLCLAPPLRADEPTKPEAKTYQVPYRLTETKHILVRAKVNGKGPLNFIIDTGAPTLYLTTAAAGKVGIEPDKNGWATFDRFEIEGGVVLNKFRGRVETPFQLEGMNGLGLAGVELHGIIGYTVLARYRLEFDFTKDKMAWTALDYNPPAPQGLGAQNLPEGLNAISGMMKFMKAFLGKKVEPEILLRGFLGLALAERDGAVVVQSVLAKSPAEAAGLKAGDRVTDFQGQEVRTAGDVHRLAEKLAPGETVQLTVQRDNGTVTVHVKAGEGL
jgi:hypothetical protein